MDGEVRPQGWVYAGFKIRLGDPCRELLIIELIRTAIHLINKGGWLSSQSEPPSE